MIRIETGEFNLPLTLESGQVFHWRPHGVGYLGSIGDRPVRIEQRDGALWIEGAEAEWVRHYFALDHPLEEIYATFPADPAMNAALAYCRGIRILRQPAWECLATFITSAMKQVKHIEQMSLAIRERWGKPIGASGLYAYPTPEALAAGTETELRECKLGFRAKNLLGAARAVASGEVDLAAVATMDEEHARAELCKLPGVGEKVANCVLLFAYERLRAFPIDVWIERVLRQIYFKGKRRVTLARMQRFAAEYFGPYGGYAQQYLFHHARRTERRGKRGSDRSVGSVRSV